MRGTGHATAQAQHGSSKQLIRFPRGLLGFGGVSSYWLMARAAEAPFQWLGMAEDLSRSFLVVAPEAVIGRYEPVIRRGDAAFLGIEGLEEALVLAMVASPDRGRATINLKSPIVINVRTWVGQQIIPSNVSAFTARYPLKVPAGCPTVACLT